MVLPKKNILRRTTTTSARTPIILASVAIAPKGMENRGFLRVVWCHFRQVAHVDGAATSYVFQRLSSHFMRRINIHHFSEVGVSGIEVVQYPITGTQVTQDGQSEFALLWCVIHMELLGLSGQIGSRNCG